MTGTLKNLADESRGEWRRWVLSGAIVVMAHGGLAAAMVHWRDQGEPDDPASAIVIELAPMVMAPTSRVIELPPGPEQVQAEATPDKPVEKVEEKPEEKIETTEVREPEPEIAPAPEPEVVLAALPPPKPEPEPPTPTDNQPPAPETTAPQVPVVAPAPVAAAPTQGQFNLTNSNAIPTWKRQIVGLLERNKRYPSAAQSRGEQGTAQLAFSLDRQGRVTASRIIKSSGSSALDHETLELVKRAQPFPPPPPEMPGAKVELSVPIRFNMR